MKALLAVFTFLGIIGVCYLGLQGGSAWIWALAGLGIFVYIGILLIKAVTGDDDWTPWSGGPPT